MYIIVSVVAWTLQPMKMAKIPIALSSQPAGKIEIRPTLPPIFEIASPPCVTETKPETVAEEDVLLLAKIISMEAGSDWLPDEWKMSVGEVVLNRVASSEFPNTLSEVIFQPGQYANVRTEKFANLVPNEKCVEIARRLLGGERYLNDPSVVFQAEFVQGSGVHTVFTDSVYGSTYFCYSNNRQLYK